MGKQVAAAGQVLFDGLDGGHDMFLDRFCRDAQFSGDLIMFQACIAAEEITALLLGRELSYGLLKLLFKFPVLQFIFCEMVVFGQAGFDLAQKGFLVGLSFEAIEHMVPGKA